MNVSRVLQQLGHKVIHITHCGGSMGQIFLKLAKKDKFNIAAISCKAETRMCTTLIDKGSGTVTELVEEPEAVESGTEVKIRKIFLKELRNSHSLIISGSKAPGYSDDIFPWMVEKAKAIGVRVICDYRGKDLINTLPFKPDIIKPNLDEFNELLKNYPEMDKGSLEKSIEFIAYKYDTISVITNGAGKVVYFADGKIHKIAPRKSKSINTIGCGDSFAAGLGAALESGKDIRDAVLQGIHVAGLNASTKFPGYIS